MSIIVWWRQRKLDKLEVKLAGVISQIEEEKYINRVYGTYYPVMSSMLSKERAELFCKITQVKRDME